MVISLTLKSKGASSCVKTTFFFTFYLQIGHIGSAFYLSASIVTLVMVNQPVIVLILSLLTRTEQLPNFKTVHGWVKSGSIVVTVVASVFLALAAKENSNRDVKCKQTSSNRTVGYIILVASLFSISSYFVVLKRFVYTRYPQWKNRTISMTTWATIFGLPFQWMTFPLALYAERPATNCSPDIGLFMFRHKAVWALEFSILFGTVINPMLMSWSISIIPPSMVTIFVPVEVRRLLGFSMLCYLGYH